MQYRLSADMQLKRLISIHDYSNTSNTTLFHHLPMGILLIFQIPHTFPSVNGPCRCSHTELWHADQTINNKNTQFILLAPEVTSFSIEVLVLCLVPSYSELYFPKSLIDMNRI